MNFFTFGSVQQKKTPSSGTGPDSAHRGYQYVYIEASGSNKQNGDKAVMSTNLQLPSKIRKKTVLLMVPNTVTKINLARFLF